MKRASKNTFDLAGKVCVVVGAGLIGSEFARRCALHGATVVLADTDAKKGENIVKEISRAGGTAVFMNCDATSDDSVKKLAGDVLRRFKKVDGVVNAIYPRTEKWGTSFEELSYEDFIAHVGLQTGPQFLTAQVFGKIMKKQKSGSIVFIGSIYGVHAPRFEMYEASNIKAPVAEYAVAKGGLLMFARYLAKFYGPYGVRVNTLSPGGVWDNQDKAFEKKFSQHAVLGNRMAKPEDLSPTLIYLFSEASSYITGQNIVVDGGWTL